MKFRVGQRVVVKPVSNIMPGHYGKITGIGRWHHQANGGPGAQAYRAHMTGALPGSRPVAPGLEALNDKGMVIFYEYELEAAD